MHCLRGVCYAKVCAMKNNKTFLAYSTKGYLVILYNFDQRTKKSVIQNGNDFCEASVSK